MTTTPGRGFLGSRPRVEDELEARSRPPSRTGPARHSDDELTPERGFDRTIEEGRRRLQRSWPALLATGMVGGIDVGTGVLALLLVEHMTGSKLLGGLAFGIGFIALTLARSELFTEDFLVPVTTVIARKAHWPALWRLWGGTLAANLVGGWIVTFLVIAGFPSLRGKAIELGTFYAHTAGTWRGAALALLGGLAITLMTWMQHTSDSPGARLVAAMTTAFLLGAGSLNHAIVASLIMFSALHTEHAPFGYATWALSVGWAILWNIVGGIGLVTILRLMQIPDKVKSERAHPSF